MKTVKVRITLWKPRGEGTEHIEEEVKLQSSSADALRSIVDEVLQDRANTSVWEAFFYDMDEAGVLLAYLSDGNEHVVFHDPNVLKYN